MIDLKDKIIELKPKQGFLIPKGVMHKTRASISTSVLVIEKRTTKPTGD